MATFLLVPLPGNIVAILDSDGTAVVQYKYDAWGRQIGCDVEAGNSNAAALSTLNPFRYRGYVYDEEPELYYLRSRYYHFNRCRFINSDSWAKSASVLGFASFSYCRNKPVMRIDGLGTCDKGVNGTCTADPSGNNVCLDEIMIYPDEIINPYALSNGNWPDRENYILFDQASAVMYITSDEAEKMETAWNAALDAQRSLTITLLSLPINVMIGGITAAAASVALAAGAVSAYGIISAVGATGIVSTICVNGLSSWIPDNHKRIVSTYCYTYAALYKHPTYDRYALVTKTICSDQTCSFHMQQGFHYGFMNGDGTYDLSYHTSPTIRLPSH